MLNFDELRSRLPIANAGFGFLRERGLRYVDKTGFVYKLALDNQPRILTRPRRFGKSTLLSTVEELFLHGVEPYDGHDSYFKGLSIGKTWKDHGNYPVLHLDFHELNSLCDTVEQFQRELMRELTKFCRKHGITVAEDAVNFRQLLDDTLEQLPPASLVLLIDEYDSPLLYHAQDEKELKAGKMTLRALFSTVKSNSGKFRCVFFTGITRFQDLDLGTAGNNFTDISMAPSFAACCGYTREELKVCFSDHLRYSAAVRLGIKDEEVTEEDIESLLDEMSSWYDGYSFDGKPGSHVFSTWSVLRFFADEEVRLTPYWSREEGLGLPRLLKLYLDRLDLQKLLMETAAGAFRINEEQFLESSLVNPEANPYSLLFQTGYLTLKEPYSSSDSVFLVCPNTEISMAFANLVGRRLFIKEHRYSEEYIHRTVEVLKSLDAEKLRAYFNDLFAALPYEHYPVASEATVAALIDFNLRGAGLKPRPQVLSSTGRADTVLDLPQDNLTLVFEYKYEESADDRRLDARLEEAITQVRERKYGLNDTSLDRVVRFAMVFCAAREKRCLERMALVDVWQRQFQESAQAL